MVEITDAISSNTTLFPTSTGYVSVATTAEDNQLARLGYYVSNTSGSSLSMARIAAKLQIIVD